LNPGRIKNGRSVINGPECKLVNSGLFPLFLARNGDGPFYVWNLSWRLARLRADTSGTRRRCGASRGRDGAARGEGDDDRLPSKVLALRRLLASKASSSSSSPSSLPGARVLVGRVLVLEERREMAQERVRGEVVGGGPVLLLGRRQVVGDVEEGELLLVRLELRARRCGDGNGD
jgi:hypothetical protein